MPSDDDALVELPRPQRLVTSPSSNRGYRHGPGDLGLWADLDAWPSRRSTATGHLSTLRPSTCGTLEWAEWAHVDGKLFEQVEFAQFIEDHISSIAAPDGGVLLDIVQAW